MNYLYQTLFILFVFCSVSTNIYSQSYREKYFTVLQHYTQRGGDSLKYKAALFLINNMEGHESPEGRQIEVFKYKTRDLYTHNGIRELNEAWNLSGKEGSTVMVPDSTVISPRILISNIDAAFASWESAPWKDEIDFSTFCNYILPYRCSNEHIGDNWRKAMKDMYSHIILGETDMLKAFAKIKKAVYEDVVLSNAYCPYQMDVITTLRIGKAECGQRAIVLADALRALGIPSAIDFTPVWADYSSKSHGWVSVIDKNGVTYTVFEDDSIAKSFNPIDASIFIPRYRVKEDDHCPYVVKQTKTPIKVYREEYSMTNPKAKDGIGFLSNRFIRDVSDKYALKSKVVLDVDDDKEVQLCSYVSSRDWMPIASAKSSDGKVIFEYVGKNSVCTACIDDNGKRTYISTPFYIGDNGIQRHFVPNLDECEEIRISRKYPLCQNIVDVWGYMRGGIFLASNDSNFVVTDTLAFIKTMPYGVTRVKSLSNKQYRFLRYKAPYNNRSSLSELQFFVKTSNDSEIRLHGCYSANGIDTLHIEYLYDDNTSTYCRGQKTEYTITVDLGKDACSKVDYIQYAPSTDLNFIEKGHLYELYYFDTSWNLIGRKIANEEWESFKNVPKGALLLLKDKTKGQEERIFEYIDGFQKWH